MTTMLRTVVKSEDCVWGVAFSGYRVDHSQGVIWPGRDTDNLFNPVQKLRMRGTITLLLNTPSWFGQGSL
jgi:hypothetical protein